MTTHRSRLALFVSSLCGALLVFLGTVSAAPLPKQVTVAGLRGPTAIGMLQLMEQQPSFAGVPSRYEVVGTPDLMVSRILTGSADFAFLPVNLAANLYARGVPIVLAATTGDGVLYLLSSRSDIRSIADLKGKRVYDIARGSTPEFLLDYVLKHNGLTPGKEVTIDFTYSHLELPQQLAAGRVDIGVLPEPFVTIAMSKNKKLHIAVDLQRSWEKLQGTTQPYPISALVVRRSLAEEHPEVVRSMLAAEQASIDWVNADPKAAGALAARYLKLPGPVIAAAMPRLNLRFVPATTAEPTVQAFLAAFYRFDPKSVGGKLPDSKFYFGG